MNGNGIVAIEIPGYGVGLGNAGVPATNVAGGAVQQQAKYSFPPVGWMFVFLIVGYVGLRLVMED